MRSVNEDRLQKTLEYILEYQKRESKAPTYLDTDVSGDLPMPDEDTMILALRHGDYLRKSKEEIVSFLRSEKDEQKKSAYVRNAYEMGLTGEFYRPGTKEHIGYHVEPSGLLIYEGSFTDRKTEVKFTWGLVAELIEALAKDKNYLDEPKENKQLSLLDLEKTPWRVHMSLLQRWKSRLRSPRLPLTSLSGLAAVQREVPSEFTAITAERMERRPVVARGINQWYDTGSPSLQLSV